MIKSITVLSYQAMANWALSEFRIPNAAYIISIVDPSDPPIFTTGGRILALQFWDVDPMADDQTSPMSQEQAESIVDLVLAAHNDPEDVPFLVNCMAGRSRSGAVGTFAQRVAGIPWEDFRRVNPQVQANGYILQQLMRIGRERGVV